LTKKDPPHPTVQWFTATQALPGLLCAL
jgi:hypothetical protein